MPLTPPCGVFLLTQIIIHGDIKVVLLLKGVENG